jgi:membrane-associated phospholipid phosphatase
VRREKAPTDEPTVERPSTPTKRGVTSLAIGFLIALVSMVCFAALADGIYTQEKFALDAVANPFLHGISSPALDVVMNGITTLGSVPFVATLFIVAMVVLLARGKRADALFLVVAIGGSVALNNILKLFIQRPRPVLPWAHVLPDYSFPSGHSMNSLVFYVAIALLIWANLGERPGTVAVIGALCLAIAVGFSRIYLGYHYFSDVIGGFAAGLGWLFIVSLAFRTIPAAWSHRPWAVKHAGPST